MQALGTMDGTQEWPQIHGVDVSKPRNGEDEATVVCGHLSVEAFLTVTRSHRLHSVEVSISHHTLSIPMCAKRQCRISFPQKSLGTGRDIVFDLRRVYPQYNNGRELEGA